MNCPECHGSNIRQITPGFFECESFIVVGLIHRPDGAGPMPAERRCGHRFQVGLNSSELCRCSRQSIGMCADCNAPLCGLHGTASSPFLCADCLDRRDQRRRDEERVEAERQQIAAAEELAGIERRHALVAAELASLEQDPGKTMSVIVENAADIPADVCKEAWLRLVGSRAIEPTHDLVGAVGQGHFLITGWQSDPGWRWHETTRADAWCAQGLTSPDSRQIGDRWLDGTGTMWLKSTNSTTLDLHKGPGPTFTRGEVNWVMLPRGKQFRVTACPQSLALVLLPNACPMRDRAPLFQA
jgi:hypothetical protein